jgi:hypothetical protein
MYSVFQDTGKPFYAKILNISVKHSTNEEVVPYAKNFNNSGEKKEGPDALFNLQIEIAYLIMAGLNTGAPAKLSAIVSYSMCLPLSVNNMR